MSDHSRPPLITFFARNVTLCSRRYEIDERGKMTKKLDPTKELMRKMRLLEEEQKQMQQLRDVSHRRRAPPLPPLPPPRAAITRICRNHAG